MSMAVVGADFPNSDGSDRRLEIQCCSPGEYVALRAEPDNPRDPRAVGVWSSRNVQIGYLTAERCGRIAALINEEREIEAVFQTWANFGAWIRVAFDGEEPVVDETQRLARFPREGVVEEPDFFPDEEWPDD